MAAIARTQVSGRYATEITDGFSTWAKNPTNQLPNSFTERVIPKVTIIIKSQPVYGETKTTTIEGKDKALEAIRVLFQDHINYSSHLQFDLTKAYTFDAKHSYATLKAKGVSPITKLVHDLDVTFTCTKSTDKLISTIFIRQTDSDA